VHVTPEAFSDTNIDRAMDAIFKAGSSRIITGIGIFGGSWTKQGGVYYAWNKMQSYFAGMNLKNRKEKLT